MLQITRKVATFLGVGAMFAAAAVAGQVPIGYISWDVSFPGNAGQFDITNLTGPNSAPPEFPITTSLNLSNLSLSVDFVGGGTEVFGSTSFTLSSDGLSFDGTAIPIGGTNPEPLDATLTGTFNPTSISDPGPDSVTGTFSTFFSDSTDPNDNTNGFLVDGDLGIIYATEVTSSATPEPGTWLLLATGFGGLMVMRGSKSKFRMNAATLMKGVLPVLCLAAMAQSSFAATVPLVVLSGATAPSSGAAGLTSVNITGSYFPAGTITPANIVVSIASSCDGTPVATANATAIKKVLGSTERVSFSIPSGIVTGTYFVTIADSTAGDSDFITATGSCSQVAITGSTAILNACIAGSSLGVLLPAGGAAGTVTAYVPKGYWEGSTSGVFVKNIEGGALGTGTTIATPNVANSCSSNPATGETVCVGNNTDVYLINGTTLTTTLTSGSNTTAGFSGGSCNNCGVALNSNNNTAVINMGVVGGTDGGVQILNLNTNTFNTPFPMVDEVSENISVNPTRSLILSFGEDSKMTILQIQSDGSVLEFDPSWSTGIENDSSAEDCSTGIAITPGEFTNSVGLANLNDITFTSPTYTAPNSVVTLNTSYGFSAGLSGSAVAQGSGHLAVVTGEFGGSTFAVLKLPATAGTAVPSLVDYAVAAIPATTACAGGGFSAGFDPHTVTAYTSPNTGDSYAVFAGYSGGAPVCLAVVDMTTVINPSLSPRGGGGLSPNDVAAADLPAGAVTFFTLP